LTTLSGLGEKTQNLSDRAARAEANWRGGGTSKTGRAANNDVCESASGGGERKFKKERRGKRTR